MMILRFCILNGIFFNEDICKFAIRKIRSFPLQILRYQVNFTYSMRDLFELIDSTSSTYVLQL